MLDSTLYSCDPKKILKVIKDLLILFLAGGIDPIGSFGEGVKKSADMFRKAGIKDVTVKIMK